MCSSDLAGSGPLAPAPLTIGRSAGHGLRVGPTGPDRSGRPRLTSAPLTDQEEPVATVSHDISIDRTPDEVWAVLGQFGGL